MALMTIAMTKDGGARKDVGRTDGQCRTIACFVGRTKKVISSGGKDDLKEQGRRNPATTKWERRSETKTADNRVRRHETI